MKRSGRVQSVFDIQCSRLLKMTAACQTSMLQREARTQPAGDCTESDIAPPLTLMLIFTVAGTAKYRYCDENSLSKDGRDERHHRPDDPRFFLVKLAREVDLSPARPKPALSDKLPIGQSSNEITSL